MQNHYYYIIIKMGGAQPGVYVLGEDLKKTKTDLIFWKSCIILIL